MGLARDGSTMIPRTRLARGLPWAAMFARMVLAAVFAWAGLAKAGDLALSRLTVRSYQLLPEVLADLIGNVLPFVEIALAVLLLIGLGTRVAAALSAVLLLGFVVGVSSLWLRGIDAACGCFGTSLLSDGSPASYPLIAARDIALLIVAVFLACCPCSRWSLDSALDRPVPEEEP
ncbi:MAG: DoxX family membrane protein [Geodermatophilaceae bacterium]|nr:DoxX family membrane protein [Geodermatophilaceae bacterium]